MATRLGPETAIPKPATNRIYPWEEWMDGGVWTIKEGEDFSVSRKVMQQYLYSHAIATVTRVSTTITEDGGIQFQYRGLLDPPVILPGAPKRGRPTEGVSPHVAASAKQIRELRRRGEEIPFLDGDAAPTLEEEIARRKAWKAAQNRG